MDDGAALILFSSQEKRRNRDVYYPYRNNSDFLFMTGLNTPQMVFILKKDGSKYLFMEMPDYAKERWDGKMETPETISSHLGIDQDKIYPYQMLWEKLGSILEKSTLLYCDFQLPSSTMEKVIDILTDLNKNNRNNSYGPTSITDISRLIHIQRMFKTDPELVKLEEAIQVTKLGFHSGIEALKNHNFSHPFLEYELKSTIEYNFYKNGASRLSYPSIVATGNNATYLHYREGNTIIDPDDLILIDAGAEMGGYAADITRTIPASGKFSSPEKKDFYQLVLEAQKKSISAARTGNTFEDIHHATVDTIVHGLWEIGLLDKVPETQEPGAPLIKPGSISEVIEKKLYRTYYMHYTSHYLGLDVHDVGLYYEKNSPIKLSAGMVFTIEPGLYIPNEYDFIDERFRGIGIRIEDNIVITENGNKNLSEAIPKEVDEIENLFR